MKNFSIWSQEIKELKVFLYFDDRKSTYVYDFYLFNSIVFKSAKHVQLI